MNCDLSISFGTLVLFIYSFLTVYSEDLIHRSSSNEDISSMFLPTDTETFHIPLFGGSDSSTPKVVEKVANVGKRVENLGKRVEDVDERAQTTGGRLHNVGKKVHEIVDDTLGQHRLGTQSAQNTQYVSLDNIDNKLPEFGDRAREYGNRINQYREKVKDYGQQYGDKVQQYGHEYGEKLKEYSDRVQHSVENGIQSTSDTIKSLRESIYPSQSMGDDRIYGEQYGKQQDVDKTTHLRIMEKQIKPMIDSSIGSIDRMRNSLVDRYGNIINRERIQDTLQQTVQQLGDEVVQRIDKIHTIDRTPCMDTTQNTIQKTVINIPEIGEQLSKNMPRRIIDRNMTRIDENMGDHMNRMEEGIGETVQRIGQNIPQIGQNIPQIGHDIPNIRQTIPYIRQRIPALSDSMPAIHEVGENIGQNIGERIDQSMGHRLYPNLGHNNPHFLSIRVGNVDVGVAISSSLDDKPTCSESSLSPLTGIDHTLVKNHQSGLDSIVDRDQTGQEEQNQSFLGRAIHDSIMDHDPQILGRDHPLRKHDHFYIKTMRDTLLRMNLPEKCTDIRPHLGLDSLTKIRRIDGLDKPFDRVNRIYGQKNDEKDENRLLQNRSYSLCLRRIGGILSIGNTEEITPPKVSWARYTGRKLPKLSFTDILSSSGESLHIPHPIDAHFDAGAEFTSLPSDVYNFMDKMVKKCVEKKQCTLTDRACMLVPDIKNLPTFKFLFGDAIVDWQPENYLNKINGPRGESVFCPAFLKTGSRDITLGVPFMLNREIIKDQKNQRIGFGFGDCRPPFDRLAKFLLTGDCEDESECSSILSEVETTRAKCDFPLAEGDQQLCEIVRYQYEKAVERCLVEYKMKNELDSKFCKVMLPTISTGMCDKDFYMSHPITCQDNLHFQVLKIQIDCEDIAYKHQRPSLCSAVCAMYKHVETLCNSPTYRSTHYEACAFQTEFEKTLNPSCGEKEEIDTYLVGSSRDMDQAGRDKLTGDHIGSTNTSSSRDGNSREFTLKGCEQFHGYIRHVCLQILSKNRQTHEL